MAPILDRRTLEFISHSPEQTQRLGSHLGTLLRGGEIVCLEGPLGSGKTCFAQGIGRGWGIGQTLISPSYVLIREYERPQDRVTFYHVDLYRISGCSEALALGIEEFLGEDTAISVIEWAERAHTLMPPEHLWVQLEAHDATRRRLCFVANGERHLALLHEFRRVAFGV
jgi:tRNA threonylcarbamoyladenosine biosynthesis protein TsaE